MSASLLRQAADSITARAAEMRAAFPDSSEPAFLEAVANLLGAQAAFIEQGGDFSDIEGGGDANALDVARAWLEVDQ